VEVGAGQSPEEWLAAQEGGCSGQSSVPSQVQIGGHTGVLLSSECPVLEGRFHSLAVVVVDGRGYTFHMDSRLSSVDRTCFAAMLAAVSFGP
jgi:hypothetical protein